jgi:hypothetical protein
MVEGRLEAAIEREISGDRPGVDQRHEKLGVVHFQARELINLTDLVADNETQIPQRVQKRAEQALLRLTQTAAEEHEQIDVRVKTELFPAVPADGNDRDWLFDSGRGG